MLSSFVDRFFPFFFSFLCLWSCKFVVLLCHLNSWKVSQYIWLSPKIVCNFLPLWFSIHLWQLYKKTVITLEEFQGFFVALITISVDLLTIELSLQKNQICNVIFSAKMNFKINTESIMWSHLKSPLIFCCKSCVWFIMKKKIFKHMLAIQCTCILKYF